MGLFHRLSISITPEISRFEGGGFTFVLMKTIDWPDGNIFWRRLPATPLHTTVVNASFWRRVMKPPLVLYTPPGVSNRTQALDSQALLCLVIRWVMFYEGVARDNGRSIGMAVSAEGRDWQRLPRPVLEAGPPGAWDSGGVGAPCAVPMAGGLISHSMSTLQIVSGTIRQLYGEIPILHQVEPTTSRN